MAIWNLGSINADHFYQMDHIPAPGETILSEGLTTGLGGKGANMSVAAARAGARVAHIGAVGRDGQWAIDRMTEYGVDTRHIAKLDSATGHAIVMRDTGGENAILVHPGANAEVPQDQVGIALTEAAPQDILVMQNETNGQRFAADTARKLGLRVAYAAAPFDAEAVRAVLPSVDVLFLNAVEMSQLSEASGMTAAELGVATVVVTKGEAGCTLFDQAEGWQPQDIAAPKVEVVDTTGAGDTFTGYFLAALDRGASNLEAAELAIKASALMVTRAGTADVIPDLKDVLDWTP
jgi:ribokinase